MSDSSGLGEIMRQWAERERSLAGLVVIGSRARSADDAVWRPDAHSDWDFHAVTANPALFLTKEWTRSLPVDVRVYAVKRTAIGQVPKITMLVDDTLADIVLLPLRRMQVARVLMRFGWHRRDTALRRALQDLAIVVRPGWRFLKGEAEWGGFFQRVVAEVPDSRIDDATALRLAELFVCDAVAAREKLRRGELVAAQRLLHLTLGEPIFRLFHEVKLRRGERSFPEGRRLERVASPAEVSLVSIDAPLATAALEAALAHVVETLQTLMAELVGDRWHWPAGV